MAHAIEQGQLFAVEESVPSAIDPDLVFSRRPQLVPTGELPSPPEEEYTPVSVTVTDYYLALDGLATLGRRLNTSTNFLTQTSNPGSASYRQIERKLLDKDEDIERKRGTSQQAQADLTKAAKKLFAKKIFKLDELVDADMASRDDAKSAAAAEFNDFTGRYYDPKNQKNLTKLEHHIDKQLAARGIITARRRKQQEKAKERKQAK